MRILYLVKSDPSNSLGHAADRAKKFTHNLENLGHHVYLLFPKEKSDVKKSFFRRCFQFFKTYHERNAGAGYISKIQNILQREKFDFILAEELSAAIWATEARSKTKVLVPIVYVAHNFEYDLYCQISKNSLLEMMRRKSLRRREANIFNNVDVVFTLSMLDRDRMRIAYGNRKVLVTKIGVELPKLESLDVLDKNKKDVVFVGALDYFPNIEALKWFSEHIFRKIKTPVRIVVAGRNPGNEVKSICEKNQFLLVASPKEMKPILENAILEVVPLLSGSGTRGKIIEAAAFGVPIISTSLGAEGLDFEDEKDILIADDPTEFAKKTDLILADPIRRKALAQNAMSKVKGYSYETIVREFLQATDQNLVDVDRKSEFLTK